MPIHRNFLFPPIKYHDSDVATSQPITKISSWLVAKAYIPASSLQNSNVSQHREVPDAILKWTGRKPFQPQISAIVQLI